MLPFWYWLNQAVLEKGPLNEGVCVCVCVSSAYKETGRPKFLQCCRSFQRVCTCQPLSGKCILVQCVSMVGNDGASQNLLPSDSDFVFCDLPRDHSVFH